VDECSICRRYEEILGLSRSMRIDVNIRFVEFEDWSLLVVTYVRFSEV